MKADGIGMIIDGGIVDDEDVGEAMLEGAEPFKALGMSGGSSTWGCGLIRPGRRNVEGEGLEDVEDFLKSWGGHPLGGG